MHTANFFATQKVCSQQFGIAGAKWQKANMRLKTKELRKDRGWTLDAVADLTGLSKGFLSQLETGSRKPSAVTLDLLSTAFHLPIAALIEADPDRDGLDLPLMIESYCDLPPEDRDNVMRLVLSLRKKVAK